VQGTVRLLDEPNVIRKKFRSAVTDSGRDVRRGEDKPGITNLIDIMAVVTRRNPEEVEASYDGTGYGQFKADVGDAVVEVLTPVRERYEQLRADAGELLRMLSVGAEKARAASSPTLEAMYERMGFVRLT
jgi:tryptophanyl-tRNA synthetase